MDRDDPVGLVIGAGSAIAGALLGQMLASETRRQLVAVSRQSPPADRSTRLRWLQCDYSEAGMAATVAELEQLKGRIDRVFICNGILHGDGLAPEKRLEQLDRETFHRVMDANALVPALWLKHLKRLVCGRRHCQLVLFSARVGSIADNHRGGWYAYRASKAALNMLVKTAAIEYQRLAENASFLLFHPGTTDTPLSRPFHGSVPEGGLLSPEFVAQRLLAILAGLDQGQPLTFLDWRGEPVPW